MKTVTYFSGARAGNNPVYKAAAERVDDFIGRQKCFAKYGGSRTGFDEGLCFSLKAAAEESRRGVN